MGGNQTATYWEQVTRLMDRDGLNQREAAQALFVSIVRKERFAGHAHDLIFTRLHQRWGISHGTYYRRLAKARRTICIP